MSARSPSTKCEVPEARIASVRLPCTHGVSASLTYYPPGKQPRHEHSFTQISFLVAGAMLERHPGRDYALFGAAKGFKPAGQPHENEWGREGALIFSARLDGLDYEDPAFGQHAGWNTLRASSPAPELLKTFFLAPGPVERSEIIWDLLALDGRVPRFAGRVPRWLEEARSAIHDSQETVTLTAAADRAGVHRGHFSRLFHSAYGMPPSIFRQRVRVQRAVGEIVRTGSPLSLIAHEAGFSDQAHMTRSIKAATGITPARLRAALA